MPWPTSKLVFEGLQTCTYGLHAPGMHGKAALPKSRRPFLLLLQLLPTQKADLMLTQGLEGLLPPGIVAQLVSCKHAACVALRDILSPSVGKCNNISQASWPATTYLNWH